MTAPVSSDLAWLDDLERAHAAATPGPWVATSPRADGGAYIDPPRPRRTSDGVCWVGHTEAHADAEAIVAAVNAVPTLIAELRKRDVVLRALAELAEELDAELDSYGYAIRNGLKPSPGDRLRSVLGDTAK